MVTEDRLGSCLLSQFTSKQPKMALGWEVSLAIYGHPASEYPEGILVMQSTQLKKHLEECSSIRPGIMDPLRAVLCKYTANVILTCLQARTCFTWVRTFG